MVAKGAVKYKNNGGLIGVFSKNIHFLPCIYPKKLLTYCFLI